MTSGNFRPPRNRRRLLAGEVAPFGIKVLIVEPGAFRTGFNRAGAHLLSAALPAYDGIVGSLRARVVDSDGRQPGDPAKAAAAILAALDAEQAPLRLPLGDDSADAISARMERDRTEFAAWEALARSCGIDE